MAIPKKHTVEFTDGSRRLRIVTGANQIQWSYGLNTVTIPTYGGEVVQILSAFVDDISIEGDARTYREMERIYRWFLIYIQSATQEGGFKDRPITMHYPHRGWKLEIKPKMLPGFRYATDVVAAQYRIEAHVIDPDPGMKQLAIKTAQEEGWDFGQIATATGELGIGYKEEDPFREELKKGSREKYLNLLIDDWRDLLPEYIAKDLSQLDTRTIGSGLYSEGDGDSDGKEKKKSNTGGSRSNG